MNILEIVSGIFLESVKIFQDMAIYLLLGFLLAGLLYTFFPEEKVIKYLGRRNIKSVVNAAIFGIPLPLCSCGVIPTALSLKRQGASDGATVSFLISTPATGADSILATYGLMGPLFAVFRPLATFVSGLLGGTLVNFFQRHKVKEINPRITSSEVYGEQRQHKHSFWEKLRITFNYGYFDLLKSITKWLLWGTLIAGVISYAVPATLIERYLRFNFLSMLAMLIVGIPLYVCATGSIPIVASLMTKGLSPGAGLVFLMAGPATNAVTITVMAKNLGKRIVTIYLLSIALSALLMGWFLNLLWSYFSKAHQQILIGKSSMLSPWMRISGAVVLFGLILLNFLPKLRLKKELRVMHKKETIRVEGIVCEHCVATITSALNSLAGVSNVWVNLKEKRVEVDYDDNKVDLGRIKEAISAKGYEVK
ncbi:MAG: SO_0444 family Cu/Zn efflux transporter [bacterium]